MGEIKVPAQSTCVQEVLSKRPDLPHCHHVPWSSKRTDRPDPDGGLGLSRPSGPVPSPPRPAPIPSKPRPGCAPGVSPAVGTNDVCPRDLGENLSKIKTAKGLLENGLAITIRGNKARI